MISTIGQKELVDLRNSGKFDADWYWNNYPDVATSGMEPERHYLWIGSRLGRSAVPPTAVQPPHDATIDVLFVDGTGGSVSTAYRVTRVAQALAGCGLRVKILSNLELESEDAGLVARYVTFFRAPFWSPYREFAERMRARGATIVFDIDDLAFDESLIPQIDGYRFLSDEEKAGYVRGVRAYLEFILHADVCTASTRYLADRIGLLGKTAYKIRNTLDPTDIAQLINTPRQSRRDRFVIGYYSGSRTHQADFRNVGKALVEFMNENPRVDFRLVGQFDIDEFPELRSWVSGPTPRLTCVDLLPHAEMIRDQCHCDIIVAPLEVGNPFCEAKSELKFFEAALVRRPVIASPTHTFTRALRGGQYGQLANSPDEWLSAFRRVFESYEESQEVASQAQDFVINEYSVAAAGRDAALAYGAISHRMTAHDANPRAPRLKNAESSESVAVVIPDVPTVSGGHRKIFALCQALEQENYHVTLYTYSHESPEFILNRIKSNYCDINPVVKIYEGRIDEHNLIICTQWLTAYDLRTRQKGSRVVYFVQDFEPMFFAAGSGYIKALATYSMGYELVCYGKWVARKIEDEVGIGTKLLPFALDHAVYNAAALPPRRDIDILFFARPSQDRRCYEIIIEGLDLLKRQNPDIAIGLFGEKSYPDLGFSHVDFGAVTDLRVLAELYRKTKVGICFSTTNPSQLGYEMIACGVVLVDVAIRHCALNFGGDEFVKYCSGTPESVRDACLELLRDDVDLGRRRLAGSQFTAAMPNESELGHDFLRMCGLASAHTTPLGGHLSAHRAAE